MRQMLFLLLVCAVSLIAEEKQTIAVNDLEGQNMDSSTTLILSNRVRSELISSNAYTVVERGEMASILQEQGFQASGACSESSCLVEIGQLLGVRYMVAGTVGKLNDNFYTVSLRMIDVGSAKIIHSASHDHAGSLERLLSEGLTAAVGKLIQNSDSEKKIAYTGLVGDLYIESSVPGAAIIIDGKETGQMTPYMFTGYTAGTHEITVKTDSFEGIQSVNVQSKSLVKTMVPMKEIHSTLTITSVPSNVEVKIGIKSYGTTPIKIDTLPTDIYGFTLALPTYKPQYKVVELENGKASALEVIMEPAASLQIATIPDSATVFINTLKAGRTSFAIDTLSVGANMVTLSKKTYKDTTFTISVQQGELLKKSVTLVHTDEFIAEKKKKRQWARRVLFGLIGGGLAGAGYAFDKKVEEANATYLMTVGYAQSTHDSNHGLAEEAGLKRNIFYGSAGAFGLGFLLSIPF